MNCNKTLMILALAMLSATSANAFMLCSEPSEPSIPSGYAADRFQMEYAKREIQEYLEEAEEYRECLLQNLSELKDQTDDVIDEWNSAVRQYNSR